jgi:hypothetical protein
VRGDVEPPREPVGRREVSSSLLPASPRTAETRASLPGAFTWAARRLHCAGATLRASGRPSRAENRQNPCAGAIPARSASVTWRMLQAVLCCPDTQPGQHAARESSRRRPQPHLGGTVRGALARGMGTGAAGGERKNPPAVFSRRAVAARAGGGARAGGPEAQSALSGREFMRRQGGGEAWREGGGGARCVRCPRACRRPKRARRDGGRTGRSSEFRKEVRLHGRPLGRTC